MQKLTMRLLIISCLLLVTFASCTFRTVKGFTKISSEKKVYSSPYFSSAVTDYVYKANITVYGKSLSGLFIAKKINDSTHRVVFTTEFGNSLMDLEIGPESFKVNSIVEDLDKKIILKTLKNDFRLILANKHFIRNEYENGQEKVYQSKDGSRFNFLFADKKAEQLHKIVRASRFKEKVIVSFTSTNGQLAETIYVKHKNIKLGIALNYLKN
ncbi:MAG: hypothetical protein WC716_15985 [Chitinophagaceae bacterium]